MKQTYLKVIVLLALFALPLSIVQAQKLSQPLGEEKISATLVMVDYAAQLPGADLADRYGFNSSIGGGILKKTSNNWVWGVDGHYLFGKYLRIDSLAGNIANNQGIIFDTQGYAADLSFSQRGFHVTAKMGKIIAFNPKNLNSGLLVMGGLGFLQHKLHIQIKEDKVPPLEGEYKKGYDRLTSGPSLTEFIGYIHLDKRKLLNFYIGAEFTQAFTTNQRAYFYDTNVIPSGTRTDLLFGIRVGWILPLYGKTDGDYYIN